MKLQILIASSISFILCLSFCHGVDAQASSEEEAVREIIETYFSGWMTGDTTKLGRAMHATCKLKNIKDGAVIVYDRATYLGFFKPRPPKVDSEGRILEIDITGNIGSAKCQIDTPESLFTDYFNLMKVNERWYIVDKIATNSAKK